MITCLRGVSSPKVCPKLAHYVFPELGDIFPMLRKWRKKDNEALKKVLLKTLDHFLKVFLNTLYITSSKSLLKNLTQKKVNVGDFGRKNATLFTIDEVAHTFPHNTI